MSVTIDQIIRSERKTICLEINRQGELIVRSPLHTSRKAIDALVLSRMEWIKKKQAHQQQLKHYYAPRSFSEGELFLFLGHEYPLHLVQNQELPLQFYDQAFSLREADHPEAAGLFTSWYRKQAEKFLPEQVKTLGDQLNFTYQTCKVSNAKKRWGSCSHDGTINLSWRLMMTPLIVIDYVIIHELAHLDHLNHSKAFWTKVESLYPDYKTAKDWLKINGIKCRI